MSEAWREAQQQLLQTIGIDGIVAFYKTLGCKFDGVPKPDGRGYLKAHSFLREDKNASMSINMFSGRFRDFTTDERGSLFDAGALGTGKDWKEIRKELFKQYGIRMPRAKEEVYWHEKVVLTNTLNSSVLHLARRKNLDFPTLKAMGAQGGNWRQQLVVGFPMFGGFLFDEESTGATLLPPFEKTLSLFQGKGNNPRSEPMITLGAAGMFNVAGLKRLRDAENVIFCEGVSDTCRVEYHHPNDDTKWAVIGLPGASNYIKDDWLPLLEGKDVFICGDADHAGVKFMAVNAAKVCTVNPQCTKVTLPYEIEEKHGKDISDWLAEDESRDWEAIKLLCSQGEVVQPETKQKDPTDSDKALPTTEQAALLDNLNAQVLGEVKGSSGKIMIYSGSSGKRVELRNIKDMDYSKAIQTFGQRLTSQFLTAGDRSVGSLRTIKELHNAIAEAAHMQTYDEKRLRGSGIWRPSEDPDSLVLVNSGYSTIFDRSGNFRKTRTVSYGGEQFDIQHDPEKNWYDFDEFEHYLKASQKNRKWLREVFAEVVEIFQHWNWRYPDSPYLLAAMVIATFYQTVWEWRPHVGIIGQSHTGKTFFANKCLKNLFGKLTLYAMKSTSAGITQRMEMQAMALLFDEFEVDAHKQGNLELARGASTGEPVFKGTADQKGRMYMLKHIFWALTTSLKLDHEADRNRWMLYELDALPKEAWSWQPPDPTRIRTLGAKLSAGFLPLSWEVLDRWKEITSLPSRSQTGVHSRLIQCFGLPSLIWATIDDTDPEELLLGVIGCRAGELKEQAQSEHEDVLATILAHQVFLDSGKRDTVAGTIQRHLSQERDASDKKALAQCGIALRHHRFGENGDSHLSLFLSNNTVPHKVLRFTRHEDKELRILSRFVQSRWMVESDSTTINGVKQRGWWIRVSDFLQRATDEDGPGWEFQVDFDQPSVESVDFPSSTEDL